MNWLNAYNRHVLNFVLTWAPFGGHSDDDAFPEFGLDAQQLWDRPRRVAAQFRVRRLRACID